MLGLRISEGGTSFGTIEGFSVWVLGLRIPEGGTSFGTIEEFAVWVLGLRPLYNGSESGYLASTTGSLQALLLYSLYEQI